MPAASMRPRLEAAEYGITTQAISQWEGASMRPRLEAAEYAKRTERAARMKALLQ